ncbi:adenylyltransferase [Geomonas sp. Red276]
MSLYDRINKKILFPAYLGLTRNVDLGRLAELKKSQYLPPEEIRAIQFASMKTLLDHCYRNVPLYRERFDQAGFNPDDFRGEADLLRIPTLTKKDLQQEGERLIALNIPRSELIADASGGSTGKPTSFFKDRERNRIRSADKMRHDIWCGWEPGESYATLWGAQREFDLQPPLKARLVERYLYRAFGFNAFDISEEKVLRCLESLKKVRPSMVVAYANVAYLFARIVKRRGLDLAPLEIKGLVSSAETLTPEKRSAIEEAFATKVFNRYGSREVGLVASECRAGEGMHVNAENVVVEILKDGRPAKPGESGEIVVTDLWNYGMPFVRYKMGDVGVATGRLCSCGRGLPLIEGVTGRTSDFLIDERGALVHGEYFTHLFYGLPGIEQFQLIQESRDLVTLNVRPGVGFLPAVLDPVLEKIRLCLGGSVRVQVNQVQQSLVEASGKFRFTISRLSSDHFGAATSLSTERP